MSPAARILLDFADFMDKQLGSPMSVPSPLARR
jgi:hypothetical protein